MTFLIFVIVIIIALVLIFGLIASQKSKKRFAEFRVIPRFYDTVDMLFLIVDDLDDESLKSEITQEVDALRPACEHLASLKQEGVNNYVEEEVEKNAEGEETYLPLSVKPNLNSEQEQQANEYIETYNHILATLKQCMAKTEGKN
ncbi:hypothetical protein NR996_05080 [Lactobacillus rodentium]|uniref:Uncharacterized protein n=1 Tax=Lactobacillus rodentium TaxID=947835 RepID=A0A2Z6T902_9LACO|nr:hypothetical protein [Lactobacillus rodentium]MCR1894781.1 hypothetical protein [Lactobacillus rodentium]GBG04968.1 hypothetical protein LrDSM24759_08820 [Lactobacillus rodentium]